MLCEMQSVSSSIWTRVAVSISYDGNHYNTGTVNINHEDDTGTPEANSGTQSRNKAWKLKDNGF